MLLKLIPPSRLIPVAALLLPFSGVNADEGARLVSRGSAYAAKFQAKKALSFYLPAEKLQPKDAGLLVAIAREYRHLMTDAASEGDKLRLGKIALEYSRRAAAAGPSDSAAQLAPAITYGKMLVLMGSKEQFEASKVIKECADRAIKLDPSNDLAWHILGRWNLGLADVGGVKRALGTMIYGTMPKTTHEDAAKCFRKALAINPDRLMHYVELGRTYVEMGRASEARKLIEKGISMRETEKDDPATKTRGRELLAKIR